MVVVLKVFIIVLVLLLIGAEEGPGETLLAITGSLQYFSARVIYSQTLVFSYSLTLQSKLQAG